MRAGSLSKRQIALSLKAKSRPNDSGCWEFQGALYKAGYGYAPESFGGGRYAHRAMYSAVVGEIPAGMYVCHHCDNRKCINPEHLFLGTHFENLMDMTLKGRRRGGSMKGQSNPSAKFNAETIARIREDRANGIPKRETEMKYGVSETQYYRIVKGQSWKGELRG